MRDMKLQLSNSGSHPPMGIVHICLEASTDVHLNTNINLRENGIQYIFYFYTKSNDFSSST